MRGTKQNTCNKQHQYIYSGVTVDTCFLIRTLVITFYLTFWVFNVFTSDVFFLTYWE